MKDVAREITQGVWQDDGGRVSAVLAAHPEAGGWPAGTSTYEPEDGLTVIHLAAMIHAPRALAALVAGGAEVNRRMGAPKYGRTPLIVALELGRVEAAQLLLAAGADPNLPDTNGRTPFRYICRSRDVDASTCTRMRRLLKEYGGTR